MREEQTWNKDAKASGDITQFLLSSTSAAAEIRKALLKMTGLSDSNTIYKSLHPKQVVSSELRVTKVIVSLKTNISINPFCLDVDKDWLKTEMKIEFLIEIKSSKKQ